VYHTQGFGDNEVEGLGYIPEPQADDETEEILGLLDMTQISPKT